MTNEEYLLIDLICAANGAKPQKVEESMVVDESGKLLRHIKLHMIKLDISEHLTVQFCVEFEE